MVFVSFFPQMRQEDPMILFKQGPVILAQAINLVIGKKNGVREAMKPEGHETRMRKHEEERLYRPKDPYS